MKPKLFFVLGLPRSKTAWASVLLTRGSAFCYHEPTRLLGSMKELRTHLEATEGYAFVGASDPNLCLAADEFLAEFGGEPRVAIARPPADVLKALVRWGGDPAKSRAIVERAVEGMNKINPATIRFDDLGRNIESTLGMWEALGLPVAEFCPRRCAELATLKVEIMRERATSATERALAWLKISGRA